MSLVRGSRALGLLMLFSLISACAVEKAVLVGRINLKDVDLKSVADGVYEGEYTIDPSPAMAANRHVKVRVTVTAGKYADIEILQPPKLGERKTYVELLSRIKDSGRLSTDAISSATVTSLALLKAIQNAIQPAP